MPRSNGDRRPGAGLRAASGATLAAVLGAALLGLPGCGVILTNVVLVFALSTTTDELQEYPIVTGVSPPTGPIEGGTAVTVFGHFFKPGCAVHFGGREAEDVVVVGGSSLTCRTPPMGWLRRVGVGVTNADGKSGSLDPAFSYWWDPVWPRRWTFRVDGSPDGALSEYQVRLRVPHDPEMKADFSDLRFTQTLDGTETGIPHWVQEIDAVPIPPEAVVWVRVPAIPAAPGTATVYAYFANPSAASASDFSSTFAKVYGEAGLAGLWHLDEGSGWTAANGAGAAMPAVLHNFAAPEGWGGADGGHWGLESATPGSWILRTDLRFTSGDRLGFDGADDFVDCGYDPAFSVLSGTTLVAWAAGDLATVNGREQVIASKWQVRDDLSLGAWTAYDAGLADGFFGAAFDGRYVYFVPWKNDSDYHGQVVRYDTTLPYSSLGSWSTYDPGVGGFDTALLDPDGYAGAVFDGRYVYFVPYNDGTAAHARVLRYDTSQDFGTQSSWSLYSAGVHNSAQGGYCGGVFDGAFVVFVPNNDHGEVLKYDTRLAFDDPASWQVFDPGPGAGGLDSQGKDADGYAGAAFDGKHLYFAPARNGGLPHGLVLRLDTTLAFSSLGSWSAYNPGTSGLNDTSASPIRVQEGYEGALFDGRYVYFVPHRRRIATIGSPPPEDYHGEVLRYDTTLAFDALSSWTVFDPGAAGLDAQGHDADGYTGAAFDGRYVFFIPFHNGTKYHGEVLRYDTTQGFTNLSSWAAFDPGAGGLEGQGFKPYGYRGAVSDGRHLYLAPCVRSKPPGSEAHGEALRFDTTGSGASYKLALSSRGQEGSFGGAPFGVSGFLNTDEGSFSVASNRSLAPGEWHHLALRYDGGALSLVVDGMPSGTTSATGFILSSTAPLKLGTLHGGKALFRGKLDEVRLYERALSLPELRAELQRRKYSDSEPTAAITGGKQGP